MKLKNTIHDHLIKQLIFFSILIVLWFWFSFIVEADFGLIAENREQAVIYLSQFFNIEWSYFSELVKPLFDTLMMSLVGTFLGVILAVPAAFLGTYIVTNNHFLSVIFRAFFGVIRTLPNLLLAAIFVAIVGIGQVTGILTIIVFTFGMVSQLIFEAIEQIDLGPIEANYVVGMSKFQVALMSIWPQIKTLVWNYALYAFEVNVRGSVVLGYVGAGGIGVALQTALSFFQYGRVGLIILIILFVVVIIDFLGHILREEV